MSQPAPAQAESQRAQQAVSSALSELPQAEALQQDNILSAGGVVWSYNKPDRDVVEAIISKLKQLRAKAGAGEGRSPQGRGGDSDDMDSGTATPAALVLGEHGMSDGQEEHDSLFTDPENDSDLPKRLRFAVLLPGKSKGDLPPGWKFDQVVRYWPHMSGFGSVASIYRVIRAEELERERGEKDPKLLALEKDTQVRDRIERLAKYISSERKLRPIRERLRQLEENPEQIQDYISSTPPEIEEDWLAAQRLFACDALLGRVNVARQFSSDSYCHLEEVWLDEVKDVLAYLAWETEEKKGWESEPARERYDKYCQNLNEMVFDRHIKAGLGDFVQIAQYIGKNFLHRGKLDRSKTATGGLIAKKAECVWRHTGRGDDRTAENEKVAINFVREFYENIVPAVEEDDLDRTKAVLEAMTPGGDVRYRHHLVNCFEAALLVYFLNPDTLRKACKEAGVQTDDVL